MAEPLKITDKDLEAAALEVLGDTRYGADNSFTDDALKKLPKNTDSTTIAMKIALIDMENSTQLSRLLGNKFGRSLNLTDIITKIQSVSFDERVEAGDRSLVSELSLWSAGKGLNLFSFFSKYCTYHNSEVYNKDDYSIFDSVVKEHLGDYLLLDDCREFFGSDIKCRKNQSISNFVCRKIEGMRIACDYEQYCSLIDFLLNKNGITRARKRRELDWFIWFRNRGLAARPPL